MILTDADIKIATAHGEILIEPFDKACLGTNSYDVHLGDTLLTYKMKKMSDSGRWVISGWERDFYGLDCKEEPECVEIIIPPEGYILLPNTLYLGVSQEYTETHKTVPFLEGRSSLGRLGIRIHATAGKGDVGFCGYWTLEIDVIHAVKVYAGMPIGQLIYHSVLGEVENKYCDKENNKYNSRSREDNKPKPSKMWKNFN